MCRSSHRNAFIGNVAISVVHGGKRNGERKGFEYFRVR